MHRAFVILLFLLPGSSAFACINDRDTLRAEAEGLPDTFHAIIGRFERNPPLYYEMRLERVTRKLKADPTQLALYDDAGAACDRLGRSDEAIDWMEQKRALLAELESDSGQYRKHQYRYLANVGTFYAHRWFRNGTDFDQLDDLEAGVNFIREAIELNPDAHFGREKYQLVALEWVMSKPQMHQGEYEYEFPSFLESLLESEEVMLRYHEVTEGLAGLVMLGNAWNSFDVFNALGRMLRQIPRGRLLSLMAWQRCLELANDGKRSIVQGDPEDFIAFYGEEEGTQTAEPEYGTVQRFGTNVMLESREYRKIRKEFERQRENAEEWHEHRTQYMMARLKAGMHPDTHKDFWATYQAVPELRVRKNPFTPFRAIVLCVVSVLAIRMLIGVRRRLRASKI